MADGREIERVWILRGMPKLPPRTPTWRIDQGYLPEHAVDAVDFREGRIRRVERDDGSVQFVHTVKQGQGVVRQESDRVLDREQFERLWPLTLGRRIRKTRHRAADGGLIWEIDQFMDLPLVMAEVELPREDAPCPFPAWLAPEIVREVSHEPRYRNHALAMQGMPA
jgi:CYTH domain-containing protein